MSSYRNYHRGPYDRRDDRTGGDYPQSGRTGFDRYKSTPRALSRGSTAAYSSNYRVAQDAEPRSRQSWAGARNGQRSTDSNAAEGSKEDQNGIKGKDFGYAFIGNEHDEYLKTHLRDQTYSIGASVDGSPAPKLTPRLVVEEYKRSGHFDTVRKQLFNEFQTCSHKQPFLDELETYLMQRLQGLSSEQRLRLAAQDQRLQHSELSRWIEEGSGAADVVDSLFVKLRKTDDVESDAGLLSQRGGQLNNDIKSRLHEVIQAERRRLFGAGADAYSDEDECNSTPNVKSSVTPLGRDTPRDTTASGSVGNQTPVPVPTPLRQGDAQSDHPLDPSAIPSS